MKKIEVNGNRYRVYVHPITRDVRGVTRYYAPATRDNGYGHVTHVAQYWKPLRRGKPEFNRVAAAAQAAGFCD